MENRHKKQNTKAMTGLLFFLFVSQSFAGLQHYYYPCTPGKTQLHMDSFPRKHDDYEQANYKYNRVDIESSAAESNFLPIDQIGRYKEVQKCTVSAREKTTTDFYRDVEFCRVIKTDNTSEVTITSVLPIQFDSRGQKLKLNSRQSPEPAHFVVKKIEDGAKSITSHTVFASEWELASRYYFDFQLNERLLPIAGAVKISKRNAVGLRSKRLEKKMNIGMDCHKIDHDNQIAQMLLNKDLKRPVWEYGMRNPPFRDLGVIKVYKGKLYKVRGIIPGTDYIEGPKLVLENIVDVFDSVEIDIASLSNTIGDISNIGDPKGSVLTDQDRIAGSYSCYAIRKIKYDLKSKYGRRIFSEKHAVLESKRNLVIGEIEQSSENIQISKVSGDFVSSYGTSDQIISVKLPGEEARQTTLTSGADGQGKAVFRIQTVNQIEGQKVIKLTSGLGGYWGEAICVANK
jgi:hypothetical protein